MCYVLCIIIDYVLYVLCNSYILGTDNMCCVACMLIYMFVSMIYIFMCRFICIFAYVYCIHIYKTMFIYVYMSITAFACMFIYITTSFAYTIWK